MGGDTSNEGSGARYEVFAENYIWKLEGLQVGVKEEVIIIVFLGILHKQGYISNMCYLKNIGMLNIQWDWTTLFYRCIMW